MEVNKKKTKIDIDSYRSENTPRVIVCVVSSEGRSECTEGRILREVETALVQSTTAAWKLTC